MRIIMLTRRSPWQLQAVNRLHRELGLERVCFEERAPVAPHTEPPRSFLERVWNRRRYLVNPRAAVRVMRDRIRYRIPTSGTNRTLSEDEKGRTYAELFADPSDCVADPALAVETVEPKALDAGALRSREPDVLIVFGTSILPPAVIAVPTTACLNLHWGLSPFYRGAYCTEWAICNDDIRNVGVTIHLLDPGIDTGPILIQGRPSIVPTDSPFSIDMKLSALGVDLLLEVISHLARGARLVARPQDPSVGKTYWGREWSEQTERALAQKLRQGRVASALDRADRAGSPAHATVQLTEASPAGTEPGDRISLGPVFPSPPST